jgi:hypothetical protein
MLPLLSILTVIFLSAGLELTARYFFPENLHDVCRVEDSIGFTYRPNCVSRLKAAEGPWVVNQYNDCGYRTKESCGPKPSGSTRVALIGSSVPEGFLVGYDETFAARAAKDLTEMCGRPVEVQNLGREQCDPVCVLRRVDEALALKPDLLIVALTAQELEFIVPSESSDPYTLTSDRSALTGMTDSDLTLRAEARKVVAGSRGVAVAKYFLFPLRYRHILLNTGNDIFLRTPFSSIEERRLESFDLLLGEIARKSRSAKVPLALVLVPGPYHASAVASQNLPANMNPYTLSERLAAISSRYGVRYVDVLEAFRQTPESYKFFYVNGHMNGKGQTLVSGPLVEQLTQGSSPMLPDCKRPAGEEGR